MGKVGESALFLLSTQFPEADSLIDIARWLINENSDFEDAKKSVEALRERGLKQDADILSKIIESYRLGIGRVNNQVIIFSN